MFHLGSRLYLRRQFLWRLNGESPVFYLGSVLPSAGSILMVYSLHTPVDVKLGIEANDLNPIHACGANSCGHPPE